MRRVAAILSTAAVAMWAVTVLAQAKPNFSGKWTIDQEKTTAANPAGAGGGGGRGGGRAGGGAGGGGGRGGGGGFNQSFTLTSDATSLKRDTEGQNGPMSTTWTLDGAKHDLPAGGRGGPSTYTAKWDGNTIVIETTRDNNGTASTSKQVYSMDGDELLITSTNPSRNGGEPTTSKQYYKKG